MTHTDEYLVTEELKLAGKPKLSGDGLDVTILTLSSLAHLCQKATDRFFQKLDYDDSYCVELFRRAVHGQDELAWDVLIQQYTPLVKSWIYRHPSFAIADEDQEYFVNRTFDNFWGAFMRDPEKLHKFKNVGSILQYLKLCTNSAVKEYVDRRMRPQGIDISARPLESIPSPFNPITNLESNIFANEIWQHVVSVLKNDQERIVAEDFLIYDLKPREIYARHPEEFSGVSQVRRIKENLMARLRRDKQLSRIFSGDD